MGTGDISTETGVRKYLRPATTLSLGAQGPAPPTDDIINFAIQISKEDDAFGRAFRLEPGGPVILILEGNPEWPLAVIVVAEPNLRLGPFVHSRSREIARAILLGGRYRGTVIDVLAADSSCTIFGQVTLYSGG